VYARKGKSKMSLYESLIGGLNEAINHEKGNTKLRTNVMTIADLEEYSAQSIKRIRNATGLSQSMFAPAMGVSIKTVEAWENGRNTPSGAAKRILKLLEKDPRFFQENEIIGIHLASGNNDNIAVSHK
jgi:putative transcriptional regulator